MDRALRTFLVWITANPASAGVLVAAIQAFLTLVGSGVAIGLVVYQQRSSARQQMMSAGLQARAVAAILALEILEFTVLVGARLAFLTMKHENLSRSQIIAATAVKIPDGMRLVTDKVHILGPTVALLVVRILVLISVYNAMTSIEERISCIEEIGNRTRTLDKELNRSPLSDFGH